jgi:hypothetical protein
MVLLEIRPMKRDRPTVALKQHAHSVLGETEAEDLALLGLGSGGAALPKFTEANSVSDLKRIID